MYFYTENGDIRYRTYSEGCPGEKGFISSLRETECHEIAAGNYVFQNREVARCPSGTF